ARWIAWAQDVADAMLELFWDDEAGGLFTTGADAERLITRAKDLVDNAVPSANGTAALALARLAALTGNDSYRERAEAILRLLAPVAEQHPTALTRTVAALDLVSSPITEIAVVGDRSDLVRAVQTRYLPNAVLAWGEPYRSPLFEGRDAGPDGGGLAYVCEDYACKVPVGGVEELLGQLS
ncbi:MAG TPA: glycoside hydrolase family 76 protein, partial [Acidimicrobiales bacterium]|nr:glycoside hydrolase family 76 protein [Acidimicrobiales bacterium]